MEQTYRRREALKNAYPKSESWHYKVDKMPDDQVNAIYIRLSTQGKLGK